ncbi:MAG: TIGR00266 family protein [Sandaracinus sp.]
MQIDIGYRPAHSMAKVSLNHGESIMAESGAMVGMSTNVQMQTGMSQNSGGGLLGGLLGGLKRALAGESWFRNTFTAANGPGEVLLAHAVCGDMVVLEMTQQGYMLTASSFIASTPNVNIDTKVQGFKGFFSGEGAFVMSATAQSPGQLVIGAFGGITQLNCDGNLVIDTGHLVAWDSSLTYKVGKSGGGWIASFLSGEGLVCHFQGQGRIWIQSRNPVEYGRSVGGMLPPRQQ